MFRIRTKPAAGLIDVCAQFLRRVHRDQRGTISILTVFVIFMFTIVLGMLVNVARHIDDKIKMQNAADASAYSGGVVLARGMNAIAFTNHLLTDVFAITAFLREARDRNSETLTPEILAEWEKTGQTFSQAEFQKFKDLGEAIVDKVPKETELITAFSELNAAAAEFALPVFESILREHQIPEFQQAAVQGIPVLVRQAVSEIAERHGFRNSELRNLPQRPQQRANDRGTQAGLLWRMNVMPAGFSNEDHPLLRTLPVVDPTIPPFGNDYDFLPNPQQYSERARVQRRELAKHYLERWTSDKLRAFDRNAEMSQFSNLWRIFSCAQLEKLLAEYPETNLPMLIRQPESGQDLRTMQENGQGEAVRFYLERNFHFLAVVYRKQLRETQPGVFSNPLNAQSDAVAFAQVSLFLSRPRRYLTYPGQSDPDLGLGGAPGVDTGITPPPDPGELPDPNQNPEDERWPLENWPSHWDLLNQNWTVKLVPATAEAIPEILQTTPPNEVGHFRVPRLGDADIRTIRKVNTH